MQLALAVFTLGLFALTVPASGSDQAAAPGEQPRVSIETSKGTIVVELYPDKTPKTVENFLAYVRDGFYDGTIFHRVIAGFMIQGGGFTADMKQKPTRAPVKNEAASGLSNERGTISMARTNDPDSATAQFFINTVDNGPRGLDYQGASSPGYTAFGRVVEGMAVVDAIGGVKTTHKGMYGDVPAETVVIEHALVVGDK